MIEITNARIDVNPELLHEELKAALGDKTTGVRVNSAGVTAYLTDDTTEADDTLALSIIAAHNKANRSVKQQQDIDRRTKLKTLRTAKPTPIDPQDYAGESPLIRALAERIEKLELEIKELTS